MRTQWFADPADGERLDETLLRPVGAASRMLDGLVRPPVAPGTGRIDAAASAVVLPHAAVPGCSLVVQVAGWSSSVGCWWSVSTDPLAGPANLELATELPLQPDGLTRAVAWLERELQRPVAAGDRRYGLARRRRWAVVLDDGYELPIRHRWLPGGGAAESGGGGMVPGVAARGGRVPGEAAALGGTALAGVLPGPGAWLLGLAVAAALGRWVLTALTPQLIGAPWTGPAVRALDLTAAAALLAWFWGAAAQRPSRVRVPMLAGLLLATLGAGLALVLGQPEWAPPVESARGALGLFLRDQSPSLFSAAALACYLRAFLGAPGRAAPRPPWPRALPVAAGVAWRVDWPWGWAGWPGSSRPARARRPWSGTASWWWPCGPLLVGLALVLVLVLLDRRPGLSRPAAQAGLAGAALLVLAWSMTIQVATSWLVPHLPQALVPGLLVAQLVLGGFAGTALLAVAAADPQTLLRADGGPRPRVATAGNRNPMARRPNRGE
jgi:hypothetical protein